MTDFKTGNMKKKRENRRSVFKFVGDANRRCGYCRKLLLSQEAFIEHKHLCSVLKRRNTLVRCQYCDTLVTRGYLLRHLKSHCQPAETPNPQEISFGEPPLDESASQPERIKLVELPGEIVINSGRQMVVNPAQQHCEYCKKKVKKPYKHRNGKCMVSKGRVPSRPRCPYCHIVFVRSTSIPVHLRNSCRVYRELCLTEQLPEMDATEPDLLTPLVEPTTTDHSLQLQVQLEDTHSKTIDVKPIVKQKSKRFGGVICQYCYQTFTKRVNLVKHQNRCCRVLKELKLQKVESTTVEQTTTFTELATYDEPSAMDSSTNIDKQSEEEGTKCVYCTQMVNKKTRYQHHNGRCVLGRANAEHPCPYCPSAFSNRSNLLRHQRIACLRYHQEQIVESTTVEEQAPVQAAPKQVPVEQTASNPLQKKVKKMICKHCNQRISEKDRAKHKEKRCLEVENCVDTSRVPIRPPKEPQEYCCGYCRKGFAGRDTLMEHQKVCTVRKLHKQVKCQYCGMIISNRGNLRKHQKLYCKKAPREDNELKVESVEVQPDKKPAPPKKPQTNKKVVIKKEKVNDSPAEKSAPVAPAKKESKPPTTKHRANLPCPNKKCNRSFQTHLQIKNHLLCCKKSKYQCRYCPSTFTCPGNRGRHERKRCPNRKNPDNNDMENSFRADNPQLINSTFQPKVEAPSELSSVSQLPELEHESLADNNNAFSEKEQSEEHDETMASTTEMPTETVYYDDDDPSADSDQGSTILG